MTYQTNTLMPHIKQYMFDRKDKVRTEQSRGTYVERLRLLGSSFPGQDIAAFTEADLIKFCNAGDDPAAATVLNKRTVVMSFFDWADQVKLTQGNCALRLKDKVNPHLVPRRRHVWLDTDQVRLLLRSMPTDTPMARRDRVLLYCVLFTGIRLDGLCNLRWSSFTPGLDEIFLVGKGEKNTEIAVPPELLEVLHPWHMELLEQQHDRDAPLFPTFKCLMDKGQTSYVWKCYFNTPVGSQGARDVVVKAGKRIGVDRLLPHDLRRSYANMLEEAGYSIIDISRLLCHENIQTTSRYMSKNPKKTKAAGKRFSIGGLTALSDRTDTNS